MPVNIIINRIMIYNWLRKLAINSLLKLIFDFSLRFCFPYLAIIHQVSLKSIRYGSTIKHAASFRLDLKKLGMTILTTLYSGYTRDTGKISNKIAALLYKVSLSDAKDQNHSLREYGHFFYTVGALVLWIRIALPIISEKFTISRRHWNLDVYQRFRKNS